MLHDLNQVLLANAILNTVFSTLFGALFGVVVGYVTGFLSAQFSGKAELSPYISKTKGEETASGFKYRILFWNAGRRDIVDVKLSAKLKMKGLDPKTPRNFSSYSAPLGFDDLFRMRRHDPRRRVRLDVAEIDELNNPATEQL